MDFYTNVFTHKGKIFVRGIENGQPVEKIMNYKPYVFVPTKEDSEYRDVHGNSVKKVSFDSLYDAKDFVSRYKDVGNFPVYGMTSFEYPFIFDKFNGEIQSYDASKISVVSLDIENRIGKVDIVTSLQTTPNEITAITISKNGKMASFACKDFDNHDPNITYYRCSSEKELLRKFLKVWLSPDYRPDVITGWNVENYDIVYLAGRIARVLGEEYVKALSPWGIVRPKEIVIKGKKVNTVNIMGVSVLDYLALYKKFTYTSQESYKLDHIAHVELNERKVDYSEYGNLDDLYEKNFQLYLTYNQQDVRLIDRLEEKMKLIELVFEIAYSAMVNYQDTLTSVRLWDVIIHNYLMKDKIVISPQKDNVLERAIVGGYVKDPIPGKHDWVVGFDLTSLYPHLIMQYGISPENLHDIVPFDVDQFVANEEHPSADYAKEMGLSLTGSGALYKKKPGFLPSLMNQKFKDRDRFKKQMIEKKKELEAALKAGLPENEINKIRLLISSLNNKQMAIKILLNSAYGALANQYFRWFNLTNAEAITLSGQLSIKWIMKKLNIYMNKMLKTDGVDYVVYADTDSNYLIFDGLVKAMNLKGEDPFKISRFLDKVCQKKFEPYIDKSYRELAEKMNAVEHKMFMKREAIANQGIWCCHPDTNIAVDGRLVKIKDLEGEFTDGELETISFNETTKEFDYDIIDGIIKHHYEGTMYSFYLEDGNALQVTDNHICYVVRGGEVIQIPASEVRETDEFISI